MNNQETLEVVKDLAYWKANAEEDYIAVPISVLRYISELEKVTKKSYTRIEMAKAVCMKKNGVSVESIMKIFKKKL
jgi:hypothetical protein